MERKLNFGRLQFYSIHAQVGAEVSGWKMAFQMCVEPVGAVQVSDDKSMGQASGGERVSARNGILN